MCPPFHYSGSGDFSMFASIELFAYGAAAVIDSVLLFTLFDARNYARVMLPIVLLTCGAWLFHLGTFFHAYFANLASPWAATIHGLAMSAMALGLVLMPGAMAHILARVARTGMVAQPPADPRYMLAYWPVLFVPLIVMRVAADPRGRFLELCHSLVWPYLGWTGLVNIAAATACFMLPQTGRGPQGAFYRWLGITLLGMTLLITVAAPCALAWPAWLPLLQALAVLAPLLPVVLFTYFVVRFNFLQLFVERTILYAAAAVILLLVYQLALHDVHARIEQDYGINAEILQGTLILLLALLLPPLRRRILESLRYLVAGARMVTLRDQIRRIAVYITQHAGNAPPQLLAGFAEELTQAMRLAYVAGWVVDGEGRLVSVTGVPAALSTEQLAALYAEVARQPHYLFTRRDALGREGLATLHTANASAAMAFSARRVRGMLLLGRRERNRDFGEEEANILVVLAEQLAVAMDNSLLQAERLAAERRAAQNERLSTLGLLAGTMAHEIKNPLSSIKTIAAVIAEDLGDENAHAADLRLIVGETNRLAATTADLLAFARPGGEAPSGTNAPTLLNSTLAVLRYHASRNGIKLDAHVDADLPAVRIAGAALQEIFFNLLNNSLEAAGPGGCVSVRCQRHNGHLVTEIHDNGPGIAPDVQDQLFQPFVTTKESGTGLGLYIVGCRVREAGGEIVCQSRPAEGTTFTIRLPIVDA